MNQEDRAPITLELTPDERMTLLYVLRKAIRKARDEGRDSPGSDIRQLARKVAETPCGNPGCSYCDPDGPAEP